MTSPATTNSTVAAEKYNNFFQPVIDKCEGCERITAVNETKFCSSYAFPETKWKLGICNFATHVKPEISAQVVKINPLKASKRAMGKR